MVVAKTALVRKEMKRLGWELPQLIGEMGVAQETARAVLCGRSLNHKTQMALYGAFKGRIPLAKLFEVVAGAAEAGAAETETTEATA